MRHTQKIHNHQQKLLAGFNEGTLTQIYKTIRELQTRLGRKLTNNEFEKLISNIKYER